MGRHKNTDGTFVPAGLKIRFEVINKLYQSPETSVKIPSARELAAQFHLSPSTVTLELQKLVREGYLIGRRGSGTYTNPQNVHFIPGSVSRKVVGILVADGKLLVYDAIDWAAQSWCGMALSPDVARPRFVTLLTSSKENVYEELKTQNLSGLIWIHPPQDSLWVIRKLQKDGLPTVAVKFSGEAGIPSIDYAFFDSGRKIAAQLAQEKRHRIFYAPTNDDVWALQRVAGIREYSAHHPEAELQLRVFSSVQNCTEELEQQFASGEIPDAFYCNGEYVFVVMDLMKKYGIDILERCRLFAEEQHVLQSGRFHGYVIRYPFREIGEKVAEMMAALLKDPERKFPVYSANPALLFRNGTGVPS